MGYSVATGAKEWDGDGSAAAATYNFSAGGATGKTERGGSPTAVVFQGNTNTF
jgi:hypothetical protein